MFIRLLFEFPAHKKNGKQSLLKTYFDKNAVFCGFNKINIVTQMNLLKVRLMCLSDQHQLTVSSLLNVTEAHELCHYAVLKFFSSKDITHIPGAVHSVFA